ncbi:UNVERIFIED_CONTAM: hypothetical protein Scaly_2960000 [Sesamum calycinum]|uniref:Uncharacterized protein n=1 Tax=Sesamum calycinum TaxID=2727403 RepID=A0AAW2KN76_9LAMI
MFYFTPRWGFFSPFPHGTTSLSVIEEYLALQGCNFQAASPSSTTLVLLSHNPVSRFRPLPFRSRYYGNRLCLLFLWLLRCFSSPGCLLPAHGFSSSSKGCPIRESPDLCLFSTPRSISSITTPFLVSGCLGFYGRSVTPGCRRRPWGDLVVPTGWR